MQKWEYLVVAEGIQYRTHGYNIEGAEGDNFQPNRSFSSIANDLGSSEWELVGYSSEPERAVFKRPKS